MGIYTEYLDKGLPLHELTKERKRQLARVAKERGRDILVYASASNKAAQAAVALDNSDLLPVNDQLSNLSGNAYHLARFSMLRTRYRLRKCLSQTGYRNTSSKIGLYTERISLAHL